jgi:hypothetical protein
MAYQKLNYGQSLLVIKSDTVRIPDPNSLILAYANETGDFTTVNQVTVAGATFLSAGIQNGAIIYCPADKKCWNVIKVIDDTTLEIKGDSPNGSAGAVFQIYNRAAEACNLYTGGFKSQTPGSPIEGGDLAVVMAEMNHSWTMADDVQGLQPMLFENCIPGSYHPINVIMVRRTKTTIENIIALW